MGPYAAGIGIMQSRRNDKQHIGFAHFPELIFRDALLKGKKMLHRNPTSLVEYLPPAILAGIEFVASQLVRSYFLDVRPKR